MLADQYGDKCRAQNFPDLIADRDAGLRNHGDGANLPRCGVKCGKRGIGTRLKSNS